MKKNSFEIGFRATLEGTITEESTLEFMEKYFESWLGLHEVGEETGKPHIHFTCVPKYKSKSFDSLKKTLCKQFKEHFGETASHDKAFTRINDEGWDQYICKGTGLGQIGKYHFYGAKYSLDYIMECNRLHYERKDAQRSGTTKKRKRETLNQYLFRELDKQPEEFFSNKFSTRMESIGRLALPYVLEQQYSLNIPSIVRICAHVDTITQKEKVGHTDDYNTILDNEIYKQFPGV